MKTVGIIAIALVALAVIGRRKNTSTAPAPVPRQLPSSSTEFLAPGVNIPQPESAYYSGASDFAPATGADENTGGEEVLTIQ